MKNLYNTSAPSIIWRIKCLTDEEKIVLFNICHYLNRKSNGKKTLDNWLLAYMCGKDHSEIEDIRSELTEKGFIIFNKSKNCYNLNWNKIESYATERDIVKEITNIKEPKTPDYVGASTLEEEIKNIFNM